MAVGYSRGGDSVAERSCLEGVRLRCVSRVVEFALTNLLKKRIKHPSLRSSTLFEYSSVDMSGEQISTLDLRRTSRETGIQAYTMSFECTSDGTGIPVSPELPPWIGDFLRDDTATIYSYYSTASSNDTAPNLPGPGRHIGNLFSSAGSILERGLGKLAYRTGFGSQRSKPSSPVPSTIDGQTIVAAVRETFNGVRHSRSPETLPQIDESATSNYSYYSTVSSNYTMSNLPGPGRHLGNLFSTVGSAFERQLGLRAYIFGFGSYANASKILKRLSVLDPSSGDLTMEEKVRRINLLLGYAK